MTTLPNHRAAAVGFAAIAIIASACASTAADTTTTSTTVEPSTTTTATTLAETTTTAPLETVAVRSVGEDIPEELLVALGDTLSWRVDQRNTTPPIPEGLAGPLLELDLNFSTSSTLMRLSLRTTWFDALTRCWIRVGFTGNLRHFTAPSAGLRLILN